MSTSTVCSQIMLTLPSHYAFFSTRNHYTIYYFSASLVKRAFVGSTNPMSFTDLIVWSRRLRSLHSTRSIIFVYWLNTMTLFVLSSRQTLTISEITASTFVELAKFSTAT